GGVPFGTRARGDDPERADDLQGRRLVRHQSQMRRYAFHERAIDGKIVLRHAARRETRLELASNLLARQMSEAVDRADGSGFVLDDKPGESLVPPPPPRAAIERQCRV